MKVYSILDRKLKEYGPLFLSRNDDAVRRAVVDGFRGSNSVMEKHPDDFDLYEVGVFNHDTGELIGCSPVLVFTLGAILEVDNGTG